MRRTAKLWSADARSSPLGAWLTIPIVALAIIGILALVIASVQYFTRSGPPLEVEIAATTNGAVVVYRASGTKLVEARLINSTAVWRLSANEEGLHPVLPATIYDEAGTPLFIEERSTLQKGDTFISQRLRIIVPTVVVTDPRATLTWCFVFEGQQPYCPVRMHFDEIERGLPDDFNGLTPLQISAGSPAYETEPRAITPLR